MSDDIVTFLDAEGNEISNDPRWQARKLLGLSSGADEEMPEDESPYASLGGAELKKLAQERGVDIKGLKKVGEVRAALEAADAADEEEADEEAGE